MKKLCRKAVVHPSPPVISDHLAFLPAAILTLAAALSPEDKEVLAYLISCPSGSRRNTHKTGAGGGPGKTGDHAPSFNCYCFRCYTSYWVRWDSSPNRHRIHEIIDAFEDGLAQGKKDKNKRDRRKRAPKSSDRELNQPELIAKQVEVAEPESVEETSAGDGGEGRDCGGDEGEEGFEKGTVRKFVAFLGERIWRVWN
ncbi:uncharacterized protein LOC127808987 [Diospyros lotus]|uniref:uncharacterized protein LOC127808987 n=1 Tax=Diospyros lotus TaxID=55363 RepID=UPI00225280B5|nr:uncharacterized protein LOC127808987 [Diospyros lotus]